MTTLAIDMPLGETAPCQLLDGRLRPVGTMVADGLSRTVPAGRLVVILTLPGGQARRLPVELASGRDYRLHVRDTPARLDASALADAEALETMRLLERGQVAEARALAGRRLGAVESGELADPLAIAAVAYALLVARDRRALGSWCLDLADAHPWLADGAVIAAEWHALQGNDLTALNYLRRLGGEADPPRFALGLLHALDRLAGYRALAVDARPSVRLREREERAGQLLDRTDVGLASELYDALSARIERDDADGPLTLPEPVDVPRRSRIDVFHDQFFRRLASTTIRRPR